MTGRVLVLGGTAEARALASALVDLGFDVESSLAGRVSRPRLPAGRVRIGGFGGIDGLGAYLTDAGIVAVVDATHPFAATISAHAAAAGRRTGVPVLRLARPGWAGDPRASSWSWVDDHDAAARAAADGRAASAGGAVFLTTGRQTLDRFVGPLRDHRVVVRVVEPITTPLPERWTVLEQRGPYPLEGERELFARFAVDTLVTKDSGGTHTRAKLDAAAGAGARVIVVRRPAADAVRPVDTDAVRPVDTDAVRPVDTVDEALAWVRSHAAGDRGQAGCGPAGAVDDPIRADP